MPEIATPDVPTTLLEAVNTLLRAVGSTEVMSLDTADMDQRAQGALEVIREQTRVVQSQGWHFNEEEDFPLVPQSDGRIALPANTMKFHIAPRSSHLDVAQRGIYLYDRIKHTYVFDSPVYANFVQLLPFEDMPEPVRWYAISLAGRIFGVNSKPDSSTYRFTKEVETDALAKALEADQEARDTTLADSSPHFANMRRR